MAQENLKTIYKRLEFIEHEFEDMDDKELGSERFETLESELLNFSKELNNDDPLADERALIYSHKCRMKIKQICSENDIYDEGNATYDEDATWAMMFPNHDDEE